MSRLIHIAHLNSIFEIELHGQYTVKKVLSIPDIGSLGKEGASQLTYC